ncbi:hypothetical protein PPYR_07647 [Photinus pyralis]|uniref:C-CAP/cofactor C-like domain-containing protein n=1 Tax=Photinus pyralis TaxID=7054 RepID=A0A5N4AHM5_PHOPY|nr:hypothetical protein PPYR_10913 [Photinus pyralis]KAB0799767.1 hypothetical protein PPYR_07647 [Photinus pyralis]
MENNNTDELCVPGDIEEAAKRATFELLPKKSAQQYDIAYCNFLSWCRIKKDMIANGQEINKSVNSNLLQSSLNSQGINISNCSNCTIHINVHKL